MALSQTRCDKITKAGKYSDGRNLYLRVQENGARSWLFRYEMHGQEHALSLGSCAKRSLRNVEGLSGESLDEAVVEALPQRLSEMLYGDGQTKH